jgi:nicotinate (nicotinamide) nucleotide adenylyltransferase
LTVLRKVAILGGAFDPVTEGHIAIAQSVLNTNMFDEVWLTPCFSHLYGKSMMSADHRVKMCGIATRVDRRIRTCMYEIANGLSGATYHFVKQLLNEELADQFVVGMDNANTFDKWMNYQELEQMIRFVVVPRNGVQKDPDVTWYLKSPHVYLVPDKPLVECSSTYVREQLVKDTSATFPDSLKGCLDPAVFDYIRKNRLYEV